MAGAMTALQVKQLRRSDFTTMAMGSISKSSKGRAVSRDHGCYRYSKDGRERRMGLGSCERCRADAEARQKAAMRANCDLRASTRSRRSNSGRAEARGGQGKTSTVCRRIHRGPRSRMEKRKARAQQGSHTGDLRLASFWRVPVQAIDTAFILKALQPIWNSKPETARRVRARIEAILDGRRHAASHRRKPGSMQAISTSSGVPEVREGRAPCGAPL